MYSRLSRERHGAYLEVERGLNLIANPFQTLRNKHIPFLGRSSDTQVPFLIAELMELESNEFEIRNAEESGVRILCGLNLPTV